MPSIVETLCQCFKIVRSDGEKFLFTEADYDVEFDGEVYGRKTPVSSSKILTNSSLRSGNLEFSGVIDNLKITISDVLARKFDDASVDVFLVNYENTSDNPTHILHGTVNAVKILDHLDADHPCFQVEVIGLLEKALNKPMMRFSPTCRAVFGDSKCRVDLEALTKSGRVDQVLTPFSFKDSSRIESRDYFKFGTVHLLGVAGVFSVRANYGHMVELENPCTFLSEGMTYRIIPGCSKTLKNCQAYKNAINFRGEPYISGLEKFYLR